jgi:CheY-like chemotaxis protein
MEQPGFPQPLCVLVVDDCPDTTASMALLVETWGHRALVANNAREALRQAAVYHPQVVFLDIAMPGMSGLEVARQLRQRPDGQSVFLVAMTGYGNVEDRSRCQAAGCNLHLLKPADPQHLQWLLALYQKEHPVHDSRATGGSGDQPDASGGNRGSY